MEREDTTFRVREAYSRLRAGRYSEKVRARMRRPASIVVSMILAGCPATGGGPSGGGSEPASVVAPSASATPSTPAPASASASAPVFRVAALGWETTVRERTSAEARALGYLRAGAAVQALPEPVSRAGCKSGWYALATGGFVCVEAGGATLDVDGEAVRAMSRRPDLAAALPYLYGIVRRQGPIYGRLPTRAQAEREEPGLDARMREWLADTTEAGAGFRASYWTRGAGGDGPDAARAAWEGASGDDAPWFLAGGRLPPTTLGGAPLAPDALVVGRTKHHNGLAFLDTAVFEGRRYAITTSLTVVPIDRLRPIEGSAFHGVSIPGDIGFPFALIRRDGASLYAEDGGKLRVARAIARRAAVKLTGKQRFFAGHLHFETDEHLWVPDSHASRLDPAKKMPKWGKKGERWLDVNVTKQTLVAYDGPNAVYATLVSTGEAGLGDPETSRSTKRGIFRIHTKHVTATMDSDVVGEEFELRDIPWVQYFEGGYALHAAYWHDDFGKPRSHGCINLAPADARWLFFFTEPKLPDGWHGVKRALTGSVVFVHP